MLLNGPVRTHVMEVAIVEVVGVAIMVDGRMATGRAVNMWMVGTGLHDDSALQQSRAFAVGP